MINLLLKPDRTRVRREYLVRLATVTLFVLATIIALGAVLLIPSLVLSQAQLDSVSSHQDLLARSIEIREGGAALTELNRATAALSLLAKRDDAALHELVADIGSAAPAGVAVTRLVFDADTEGPGRLQVSGTANTRTALLTFSDALEASRRFAAVDLPVSNLARERDIEYILTVTLAP